MKTDLTRQHVPSSPFAPGFDSPTIGLDQTAEYARAADVILDDLFLSVGQAIGLRASMDFDAVVWLRAHFRQKFVAALNHQGNRWLEDRAVVTAVSGLFAERAVRYANGADTLTIEDVRRAAADVERYCHAHARRGAGRRGAGSDSATALIAGYWCTWEPEE
jgi:hypothetical protein